jgi:hypothetical protein
MTGWKFRFIFETALIHGGDNHFNHFKSFYNCILKKENEQRSVSTRPGKKRKKY